MDHYKGGASNLPPAFGSAPSAAGDSRAPGVVRVLWRRKLLVIVPVLIAVCAGLIYVARAPKLYTSRGRLDVKPAGSRLDGNTAEYTQLSNFLYTQREKLLSRDILAGVLGMPTEGGLAIKDLATFQGAPNAMDALRDGLEVEVGKKDDTLIVYFEGPDAAEAKLVVDAVVDNYIQYQTRPHKRSSTPDVLEVFKTDRTHYEQDLAVKTNEMAQMEGRYGLLSGKDQENTVFRQLAMISEKLSEKRAETLKAKQDSEEAAKAVHRDARVVSANPGANILAGTEDEQSLRTQLIQLQNQMQSMQGHYLPDHPGFQQLRQRMEQLSISYADAIERRYLRTKAMEDELQKQFDQTNLTAQDVSVKIAQYGRLQADSERLRHQVEQLDTRIHEVELQAAAGSINIEYFEPALAAKRSHPAPLRSMALALLLGLGCGVTLALSREWLDDRLRSADEIRTTLGMPLLGVVPQMPAVVSPTVTAQKVVLDPTSDVAEAYRSLRTAIHFGAPKDRCKTILVTSPTQGDGKTTSAANLACVLSQAGKRVLLMDADLRNPRQHIVFGLKPSAMGLSAVLSGQIAYARAIQTTPIPGLDLMQCGPKPRNPSEMLNGAGFAELLETLTDKYDNVVIDSPPVMGLADSRIISASCDLTLLVLRADKTTRKASKLARDGLVSVGAHILGVIVNDVSRRSEGYYETSLGYGQTYGSQSVEPSDDPIARTHKPAFRALPHHDPE